MALETRFRVFVAGALVDEVTALIGAGDLLDMLGERHGLLCAAADAGDPWMIEVRFPDGEHVRWGTDSDGMVLPIDVTMGQLEEMLAKYGDSDIHDPPGAGWTDAEDAALRTELDES